MRLRILLSLALLIGAGALAVAAVGRTAVAPPDRKAPTRPTVDPDREPGELRPVFHFGATDNRTPGTQLKFRCAIDSPLLHPCAHIHRPFSALAFGSHLMRVRALDRAGNASRVAAYAFTVVATWDAAADFAQTPNPENPGRDRYGNTTWFYLYSGTTAHDPSDYHVLPVFLVVDQDPNFQVWRSTPAPWSAGAWVGWSGQRMIMHPGHYNLGQNAILGWRSPVTSSIKLHATISRNSNPCPVPQDGIIWSIDQGPNTLQSGPLAPGESKTVDITTSVAAGDSLYLTINGATDTNCDATNVDLTLMTQ